MRTDFVMNMPLARPKSGASKRQSKENFVVYYNFGSGLQEEVRVFGASKVAALIGIHDLRYRFPEGFSACIEDELDLHVVAYLPMEDIPGIPVDYGYEIKPVSTYWDVCDIY